ncbi:serine hydrolase domain-containing protein [Kineosporia succinea]|uniref:D-alanyl-D-alanine carboxypeptidase n=1 Tax=Kineosporia succinea TaxID=84632 RepID=A0ABT9P6S8_9ACTN|nr:serine hydrolase domain-containing protein [Kineosporia succinea]MDP9828403.1 D-alanyl-D-alanine carboxypeptidase [Kineosporia succinea]
MKSLTAFVLASLLCGGAPDHLQRDADALVSLGVVGVQAQIMDGGGTRLVTAGVSDRLTRRPMPRQGRFRIASTRKAMVAVVALQLVEEKRLRLDDPVALWWPGADERITVRHLLQNTSGLHDDQPGYTTPEEYSQQRYDVHTRAELIARSLRHPLDFAPGSGWGYSNTGFLLMDVVVERVGGAPSRRLVEDRIARPLGLRSLGWPGTSPALPDPHSRAYQQFPGGTLTDVTEQVPGDPDAIIASTRDLNVFFRALLGGRLLAPAQLAEMQRTVRVGPEVETFYPGAEYGLGLISRPLPCGGRYWGHDGGDAGFITVTGVTASGRRSVVITMNTALGGSADSPLRQQRLADELVNHALCE